eukprot:SAG25_NODE_12281_length_283_cov_0.847826_2_plen_28_part_01
MLSVCVSVNWYTFLGRRRELDCSGDNRD